MGFKLNFFLDTSVNWLLKCYQVKTENYIINYHFKPGSKLIKWRRVASQWTRILKKKAMLLCLLWNWLHLQFHANWLNHKLATAFTEKESLGERKALFWIHNVLRRAPEPRLCTTGLRIRIRILLFSSVAFKMPTKFLIQVFWLKKSQNCKKQGFSNFFTCW